MGFHFLYFVNAFLPVAQHLPPSIIDTYYHPPVSLILAHIHLVDTLPQIPELNVYFSARRLDIRHLLEKME